MARLMVASMYDALKEAGASDDCARAAATDIANYDDRLTRVEGKLDLLQWMLGANIGLTILILGRTFVN